MATSPGAAGDEWLAAHSLHTLELALEDVLKRAKITRDSKVTYSRDVLEDNEAKLKDLRTVYSDRIQWLTSGSRRWFGHVRGDNVVLLVDNSDAACDLGRVEEYSEALRCLVEEQLSYKSLLHVLHYGTDLYKFQPVDFPTNRDHLRSEVMESSMVQPMAGGCCNLLAALRYSLMMGDHVTQRLVGCTCPMLHLVAFDCEENDMMLLKRLSEEISNSSFHHYQSGSVIYDNDLSAVKMELSKCENILFQVQRAKTGLMNAPLIEILKELSLETDWTNQTDECLSLDIAIATGRSCDPDICTSHEWLETNGINGAGLNLYQLLSPDAIIPHTSYVPVLHKTVTSLVNNASIMFPFPDGRMRKLHVDFPLLCYYQTRMDQFMVDMERRIDYITTGSRRMFGLLAEKRVLIMVDTSAPIASHITKLQQDLKVLIQDQLPLVNYFNMASFNSNCDLWKNCLVEPTPTNLSEAWMWVAMLKCEGTCNVMSSLKGVLQHHLYNSDEDDDNTLLGIYLIMGNQPDQDMCELHSYVEQCIGGTHVRLHITFYGDSPTPTLAYGRYGDEDTVARCLQHLSTAGHGRYHRYCLSGTMTSDDVELIRSEINKGVNYQYQVDRILQLYYNDCINHEPLPLESAAVADQLPIKCTSPTPPPRHNNASLARMNTVNKKLSSDHGDDYSKQPPIATTTTSFYLDWGLRKGHITLPVVKCKDHVIRDNDYVMIPEMAITMAIPSQQWISKYGREATKVQLDNYMVTSNNLITGRKVFHLANKKGELLKLNINKKGARQYVTQLRGVVDVYRRRLEWLSLGSRAVFGVVCEYRVAILLDCSASMTNHWPELTNNIELLLTEQLIPRGIYFTIISFATSLKCFTDGLITVGNSASVVNWMQGITPSGCTSMLEAIKVAMVMQNVKSIILVSDGNQNHTREYFMDKISSHYSNLPIHTVAYHCDDSDCHQLLMEIATTTGGRFHDSNNIEMSDDYQLMATEFKLANQDLSVISSFV
ncbi:von Willebrand factor A domain-containing protein 3A-like isoform X2 [Dysidea avara]|uniref:von Willebrand factor A domain-containing protein 3A-like isoform X2 n=1 Tax=Dysidea avara TaxID=196820 RepID=UPI0033323DD3